MLAACGSSSKARSIHDRGGGDREHRRASSATVNRDPQLRAHTRVPGDASSTRRSIASGLFNGKVGSLIKDFGGQEDTHVEALKGAVEKLGGTPAANPNGKFPIDSATQVAELAYTVENLGAAAYLGQAANIQSPEVLAAALAIHTVEARHAATLGTLVKKSVTPDGAFAKPADMSTVLAAVKPFLA